VREEKRLSWVISLFNSGLMSVVGVVYFVQMVSSRYQSALTFSHGGRAAFHSRDNYVVLACLWFALASFADMVFGLIHDILLGNENLNQTIRWRAMCSTLIRLNTKLVTVDIYSAENSLLRNSWNIYGHVSYL
jgi:hypothetical protein